jgi:hypothetical protein
MRVNPETEGMTVPRRGREGFEEHQSLNRGLTLCDTEAKVLLYCYKYMFAHYDAYRHVIEAKRAVFDEVFQHGKPVFIDFGCGPLTSGMALADYYRNLYGNPLTVSYTGIDICDPMLAKAGEFSTYEGSFGADSDFTFLSSWNDIEPGRLRNDLQGGAPLVLNFSYFFGQEINENDLRDLSAYVRNLKATYQETKLRIVFLNASYPAANERYREFKRSLGLSGHIGRFDKVRTRYMTDFNQLEYQEPEKTNVCYEVLSL